VLFLLQQQGHLASRIEELGAQRSAIARQVDTSRVFQLREDYREVGRDLVKLLRFVDMNATGLRKILKKFDKRFGYKFTDYYVTTRANHPYSQLQQVFKQVVICWHFTLATAFIIFFPTANQDLCYLSHTSTNTGNCSCCRCVIAEPCISGG
jgi:SPX domain protein involved in polyphosphate accumulation